MKRIALLLIIIAAALAATATVEAGICIHRDGYIPQSTQAQCQDDPSNGIVDTLYVETLEEAQPYIQNVCCAWRDADGQHIEPAQGNDFMNYTCQLLIADSGNPGEATAGSCSVFPGTCDQNETACWCGPGWDSQYITDPLYCCDDQANDGYCESTGETSETPTSTTCGNQRWDRTQAEACDPTAPNPIGDCGGSGNACTTACSCAISEDTYDPTDIYCSPGEDCSGAASSCTDGPPTPQLSFYTITGELQVEVRWGFEGFESCDDDLTGFELYSELRGLASIDSQTFGPTARTAMMAIEPDSTYDFRIIASYGSGVTREASAAYESGDTRCYETDRRRFCNEDNTGEQACDTNNEIVDLGTCTEGSCFETEDGGTTCTEAIDCDQCDGAYESTAESDDRQVYSENYDTWFSCEDDLRGTVLVPGNAKVQFCYYGQTYGSVAEYESCADVTLCSDYLFEDVCGQDPCGALGTCAWYAGGGCNAQEAQYQTCEGIQDQSACESLGRCAWANDACVEQRDLSCAVYGNDRQACTGGSEFTLSPSDHQELERTTDTYRFGKCEWTGSTCVRDANDDEQRDILPLRADGGDPSDFTNPVTSIPGYVTSRQWGRTINFPVYMNERGTYARTYMDLTRGACPSTPPTTEVLPNTQGQLWFSTEATDGAGNYCLSWYSIDANWNTERVRTATLDVNPAQLDVERFTATVQKDVDANTADLAVRVSLTRVATCNISVRNDQHKLYTRNYPHEHHNSVDRHFDLNFTSIAGDTTYYADLSCSANGDSIQEEYEIPIEIDERITAPFPSRGTYTTSPGNMGVWAEDAESCALHRGDSRITLQELSSSYNGSHTRWFQAAPGNPGYYGYTVSCVFDGEEQDGGASDQVRFAIDREPPAITITLADGTPIAPGQAVLASPAGTLINITCHDPPITGGDSNWEYGCEALIVDGEERGTGSGDDRRVQLRVRPQDRIEVWGRDAGGNEATAAERRVIRAESSDISGPERPVYEVRP